MANKINFKNTVIGLLVAVFATTLFAQKPRDISGTVVGTDGKNVAKTTVILMASDGTEVKRVETSRRGKFSFKKVSPGNYTLQVDAGEKGRLDVPAEVSEENLKLGDIQLAVDAESEGASTPDENSYDPTLSQASSNALTDDPMMVSPEPDTTGNQGQDQEYHMNQKVLSD